MKFSYSRFLIFVAATLLSLHAFAQVVEIPAPNLRQAIRERLELPDEVPITQPEMLRLKKLNAKEAQIENITGLEYAINLKTLVLGVNNIQDITPLAGLINLGSLNLQRNPITDLDPLSDLAQLTYLNLAGAPIKDLAPLANLTQLKELHLGGCQISDLTPLSNLTQLMVLSLSKNQIVDVSPLANLTALKELRLDRNQIVDVSPLVNLTQLTNLTIANNPITDFRPLFGLNLQSVDIDIHESQELASSDVEIADPNLKQAIRATLGLSDEVALTEAEMLRLVRLKPTEAQIQDLTGLEYAKNLKTLDLAANDISDITPLSTLTKLTFLILAGNPTTDLTPLANLINLTYINLAGIKGVDISPLAHLTQLRSAFLGHMGLRDITPLASLINLEELNLRDNLIEDITSLANLTQLQELHIYHNWILDFTPLDGLSLVILSRDEVCLTSNSPIEPRLENRTFPSTLKAFDDPVLNRPELSKEERIALHDLWLRGVRFQKTNQGYQLTGNIERMTAERDALLALNPNMIFLAAIRHRDAQVDNHYPEDWPYWVRDENGNPIRHHFHPRVYLMDITLPEVQDIIVEQAISVDKCGLFDGIFFDSWVDDGGALRDFSVDSAPFLRPPEAEREARLAILQSIRASVPDDFLILCNQTRRKLKLSAPYVNGAFMETFQDYPGGYTYGGLIEIESTLLWSENNLQEPQINFLEGWGIASEPPDSPANKRWMRVFTTMSLTHSNGYVLYNVGKRRTASLEHAHNWYNFWDAEFGRPIGPKAQRYQNTEGLFIREFTNGWAVYNRTGQTQPITLPSLATPVSDRGNNAASQTHLLPDLDGEIYLKAPNPADVNSDGKVNVLDLVQVANELGKSTPDPNGDGVVNILDLVFVAQQFSQ